MHKLTTILLFFAFAGCSNRRENTLTIQIDTSLYATRSYTSTLPVNYDSLCMVGKFYIIYGHKNYDPFRDQEWHRVYIKAKKQGWVKYVYDYDAHNADAASFTRTTKEFIEQTVKP